MKSAGIGGIAAQLPVSKFYDSQRLRLHYLDWGGAKSDFEADSPVVLVHGGRDHAHSWDEIAIDLCKDQHVVVPDLRGHGDSAWAIGSLYHILEYVVDLAQLIATLDVKRVRLIGHSMGAFICAHFAGAFPERVENLIAIEGLDPPANVARLLKPLALHEQIRETVLRAQAQAGRSPRTYAGVDVAAGRMREENTALSETRAMYLTEHGLRRSEAGTYHWKFDDYARGPKPFRFGGDESRAVMARIECPTLLVCGGESDTPDPADSGLLDVITHARSVTVEGAGHWVHHDRKKEVLALIRAFLRE